jgi:hypothetical protein
VAIDIEENNERIRFNLVKSDDSQYSRFVDARGWVIKVHHGAGPDGQPTKSLWGRWLLNLLLNFTHLALWFVCLWLLLRFQWSHALGLAFVLWLTLTLTVLPMLLSRAGSVAQERAAQNQAATPSHSSLVRG